MPINALEFASLPTLPLLLQEIKVSFFSHQLTLWGPVCVRGKDTATGFNREKATVCLD